MSENKRGNYAKVYAFGADNTIALDGNLKSGAHYGAREAQEGRLGSRYAAKTRLRLPVWVFVFGVAALLFALSMAYLGRCVAISSTTKQIYRIREELARVTQTNEALEVQIAEKADDTRIQTLAINSLGMKQATEDVIYTVAPVAVASREKSGQTDTAETVVQKTSGTGLVKDGFFGLLLHMIGL